MSFPHPLRSLAQLPDLSRLRDVCQEFDIEITLFGSTVRRLARALIDSKNESEPLPDLFQLCPFLSDIDLLHSGKPEQSDQIKRAILDVVPFSEFFRWEIFNESEHQPFRDDEIFLPVIPVDKMTLSTRAGNGIQDPFAGYLDLRRKKYRLLRSPFYSRSRLRREYKDSEFIAVFSYLKLLFEQPVFDKYQPGWNAMEEIARDSRSTFLIGALQESAYLRARFRYRWNALRAACRELSAWEEIITESEFRSTLNYINYNLEYDLFEISQGEDANELANLLVTSCRLVGDLFRLEPSPLGEETHDNAAEAWSDVSKSRRGLSILSKFPYPTLPSNQEIVAVTPEFEFNRGKAPSASLDEHLHIQMPLSDECAKLCKNYGETFLAAFALITAEETPDSGVGEGRMHSLVFPFPTVCRLLDSNEEGTPHRLQIRVNCGHLLEVIPELIWQNFRGGIDTWRVKLFIVGSK